MSWRDLILSPGGVPRNSCLPDAVCMHQLGDPEVHVHQAVRTTATADAATSEDETTVLVRPRPPPRPPPSPPPPPPRRPYLTAISTAT